jgi:signal peptidase I
MQLVYVVTYARAYGYIYFTSEHAYYIYNESMIPYNTYTIDIIILFMYATTYNVMHNQDVINDFIGLHKAKHVDLYAIFT